MGVPKDKLNETQKAELERIRLFVVRNRLNPKMNGTLWRAAIDAIQSEVGYQASFRVKSVFEKQDPPLDQWDTHFPDHLPLYNSIEWLELNTLGALQPTANPKAKRFDYGPSLKQKLLVVRIPLAESSTGIRILGYSRS